MKHVKDKPKKFDDKVVDAGHLHEWLATHGVRVNSVSITEDGVVIDAFDDPTEALAAYEPKPNRKEQIVSELDAIDLDKANPKELAQALKLVREWMKQ